MKKILLLSLILAGFLFPAAASTTIAVLPYKIAYEGRIPSKYTPEQLAEFRVQEGQNYQASMINYLTKMNRKPSNQKLDITVLSLNQVNALMTQKGITAAQLDSLTNTQLAEILGISHVVRGTATRTFIMSDELSLGITAVSILTSQPLINSTSNISLINSMEDLTSGGIIFSRQFNRSTSATRSDEQSLRDAFRKSSRRMLRTLRN